jgi:hypothetical protein
MPAGIPAPLVPLACAYVVVLEIVLVLGVFARSPWIFWTTFGQLLLFHVVSWSVVGWFYPVLMFAILSILPLARLRPIATPSPGARRLLGGREPRSTTAFLLGFSLLQMLPWCFPGDTAITGEGRVFALHMFDARVVCEAQAVLHDAAGKVATIPINQPLTPRMQCDPIVYLSVARGLCRILCDGSHACVSMDLLLRSRRSTEPELRPVIDVKDFCRSGITYDVWRPNPWISKQ